MTDHPYRANRSPGAFSRCIDCGEPFHLDGPVERAPAGALASVIRSTYDEAEEPSQLTPLGMDQARHRRDAALDELVRRAKDLDAVVVEDPPFRTE